MKSSTLELLRVSKELKSRGENSLALAVVTAAEGDKLGKWQKRLSTLLGIVMGLGVGTIESAFITLAKIARPSNWKHLHKEVAKSLTAHAREISRAFGNLVYAWRSRATLHMKLNLGPGEISSKLYDIADKLLVKQAHSIGGLLGSLLVVTAVSYLLVKVLLKINRKLAQAIKSLIRWSTGKDPDQIQARVKRFFLGLPARAKVELLAAMTMLGSKLKGRESSLRVR